MLKIKKTDNPIAIRSQRLICQSFLKKLHEKPYDKITITEVCKDAKLVRETFYRNFSSKEAVVKGIIDEKFSQLYEGKGKTSYQNIEDFFIAYFAYWESEKEFLCLLIENHLFPMMLNKTIESLYRKIDCILADRESEKTKNYIASLYAGAINSLLFSWVKNEFEETPEEMARILKSYSVVFNRP